MNKIIDLHCDTIQEIQAGVNFRESAASSHIDLNRLKKGNVGVMTFACFISSILPQKKAFSEVNKLLDLITEIAEQNSEEITFTETADEIEKIINSDKIGILAAVENGHAIENNLDNLEKLRMRGVRYMTLTHSKNLSWAASSGEKSCDFEGLTNFGEKVISAMNDMGVVIDVSHVHESTFWDVARLSNRPFIASHSNASSVCPIARNLTDDQIKAIADSGGMVGINFFPGFLDIKYWDELLNRCGELFEIFDEIEKKHINNPVQKMSEMRKWSAELKNKMADQIVKSDKIIEHIDHIIKLVGDDYVGFGSDFDGVPALPANINGCDYYPELINMLEQKGYNNTSIEKISHRNFIRVLSDNE